MDKSALRHHYLFRYAISALIILIAALVLYAVLDYWSNPLLSLTKLHEYVAHNGDTAIIVFWLIMTVSTMFGMSAMVMTLIASALFNFSEAFVISITALTASAVIAFALGRQTRLLAVARRVGDKRPVNKRFIAIKSYLHGYVNSHGFTSIIALRLSMISYALVSYALGAIRTVKFWDYFWATLVVNIVMSSLLIIVGKSLSEHIWIFTLVLTIILGLGFLPRLYRHRNI